VRRGIGSRASAALAAVAITMLTILGGIAPQSARAAADPSDVVLVFDFSASILRDETNRNRFAAALEGIAARVDAITADLVAGDATVSIVGFATKAADYPSCVDLRLLQSPSAVAKFAGCLRSVATVYRKGGTSAITRLVGTDTNYVAAMQRAAVHLPADSVRPALILFTDGRHDVPGVPVTRVQPTRDQLFGNRPAFALLPVGMGLDPKLRSDLTRGLEQLRIVKGIPACVSGSTFQWPTVTFQTAAAAGNAVGVALQDATCTFTVAPTPTPIPTPPPQLAPLVNFSIDAGDGTATIHWASAPAASAVLPVTDFQARCRPAAGGDYVTSSEGSSTDTSATISCLTNGSPYQCEVAAVSGQVVGAFTPAGLVTPIGVPPAPAKPTLSALNGALTVTIPTDQEGITGYTVECSADGGATWSVKLEPPVGNPTVKVESLTNGTDYVCRTYATNAIGTSAASPPSDSARPCGSLIECNTQMLPLFGGILGLLALGIFAGLVLLARTRVTGYVIAVVDVIHTANIGHGSSLGISMTRAEGGRSITGLVADTGPNAELRIRRLRNGSFAITDRNGRREVADGAPGTFIDSVGVRHAIVLQAFDTNAASRVARRR
jgi:hypothetical protein